MAKLQVVKVSSSQIHIGLMENEQPLARWKLDHPTLESDWFKRKKIVIGEGWLESFSAGKGKHLVERMQPVFSELAFQCGAPVVQRLVAINEKSTSILRSQGYRKRWFSQGGFTKTFAPAKQELTGDEMRVVEQLKAALKLKSP